MSPVIRGSTLVLINIKTKCQIISFTLWLFFNVSVILTIISKYYHIVIQLYSNLFSNISIYFY